MTNDIKIPRELLSDLLDSARLEVDDRIRSFGEDYRPHVLASLRKMISYAEELLAAPVVESQEPVWTPEKPETPGAYWIRGFNLSGEFNEAALVQVVLDEDEQVLMVNLHQSTTETDTGFWYEVDDINEKFEWCGPLLASPPAPVAVVLPERKTVDVNDGALDNARKRGYNACIDDTRELIAMAENTRALIFAPPTPVAMNLPEFNEWYTSGQAFVRTKAQIQSASFVWSECLKMVWERNQ